MDTSENVPTSEWLEQNNAVFVRYAAAAGALEYQEQRIADVGEALPEGAPREIALGQLHDEQREEFAMMLAAQKVIPYDELLRRSEESDAELVSLTQDARTLRLDVAHAMHGTEEAVEHAVSLVPAAEQQLIAYMEEELERITGTRSESHLYREYDVLATANELSGVRGIVGYMPIPHSLSAQERAEIAAQVLGSEYSAQWEREQASLPFDVHALASAVRKANPDVESQGISTLAALLLLEDPTHEFTAAEIGSVLYDDVDEAKAMNRAGALLYHSLEGRTGAIGKILSQHGYRLVRDVASQGAPSDQQEARPRAIYRLAPLSA